MFKLLGMKRNLRFLILKVSLLYNYGLKWKPFLSEPINLTQIFESGFNTWLFSGNPKNSWKQVFHPINLILILFYLPYNLPIAENSLVLASLNR